MRKWHPTRGQLKTLVAVTVVVGSALTVRQLMASDHQDSSLVQASPKYDVNDVYAFPSKTDPRNTVLVLGTQSPITPGQTAKASFGKKGEVLYQLKIDNTGDAMEDLVLQFTFTGQAGKQKVTMRGPYKPNEVGTANTLVDGAFIKGYTNTTITSGPIKLFAGPRDDPFFIDLAQFFMILPDRKPDGGFPATQTTGLRFRDVAGADPAVDFLAGFNDMAIVVELPTAMLAKKDASGNAVLGKFGVWGTTSQARGN